MAWVERLVTRTAQPQDGASFSSSSGIPTPIELWLPANSSRGLVNSYAPSVEASFVTQPNSGGNGIRVTSTGRRYPQQNILNSSTHRAWVVVAYRNFGGGGTQSIVRKDGALTPLQESSGVVNAAHFFSGVGLRITKYPGSETVSLEGRVNVFTGYGDSNDCFIALNNGDEASVGSGGPPLSSTTNPIVFGSAENGGEVASSWVIMAVGIWQGASTSSIPSRKQLKSFRENPWQLFEPEVSRIWVDDYVSAGGGATVIPVGVQATGSVGTPSATGAARATPAGVSASSAVGTPVAVGGASIPATVLPAGVQATGAVGTVSATGAAVAQPVGVTASGAVGTPVAIAGTSIPATVLPAGVQALGVVGTPTAKGVAIAQPLGVAATAYVGTPTIATGVSGVAVCYPAGVQAIGQVGTLIATGAAWTAAVGVQAVASVGTPTTYAGEIVIYVAGAQTRPSRLQSSSRASRLQTGSRASR